MFNVRMDISIVTFEELDKDFQNWSKNKVIKKCPRCKIYTEKNEGEYQDGHFTKGTCNGLQFAHINFLSEQKAVHIEHFNREDQADGCFLCVDEIEDKLQFLNVAGPFGWYHGNKCLECIISLFLLLFFFIPGMVISAFFDIPENSEDTDPLVVNST